MSRTNQLETIERLIPQGRTRWRGNCPYCNGTNTLGIQREHGQLSWNCFKAACPCKGKTGTGRTLEEMRLALGLTVADREVEFELPDHLTNLLSHEPAITYLRKNNCWQAYTKRLADIRYDPRLDRVVFCTYHARRIVGATGRALDGTVKPKWFRYDKAGYPFVCGTSDTAVIVEDAASACAVAPVATGIALMGTNLSNSHLSSLKGYKEVIVALDLDATKKAIDMERSLSYFGNVRTALLSDDLKYSKPDEIRRILKLT